MTADRQSAWKDPPMTMVSAGRRLSKAGWELGAVSRARITSADNFGLWPQRSDAGRFIGHADEMRTAFLELQAAIHRRFEPQMESQT
jgi:hypothetical protein